MLLPRLVDVRPGERLRVLRMFALIGLIIATSYVLKPVRSSLFLSQFGASNLPFVYIALAVVLGFVSAAFSRFVPRANLPQLLIGLSYFFASNLVLFWIATISGWVWTGFLFYVWVSIFTALMPSLFWLLANYVFYANEGRRLFPVVLAGGLSGSILGGASTTLLAPAIGTPGLMLPAASLLVLVALLTRDINVRERERMSERRTDLRSRERSRAVSVVESPYRLLLRSRYLTMLAALVLITSLTSTLVDYQFNAVVEKSFLDRDSLTRFLGSFFAFVSFLAFVLQLLLAGPLLSRLGVGSGLISLPLAIATSTFSFILYPSLLTAALLKTADDGINNSVHRASIEVLYLPITLSLKNRLKTWIDMFVERVSRGLGGLVILGSTSLLGLGAHHLGYAVLALAVPWILLVLSLRREYVNTLRESIAKRDITDFDSALRDPATRAVFHQVLTGTDVREIAYALELAQGIQDPAILDEVAGLASHQSPVVRAAALRALQADSSANRLTDLESRVEDEDPEAGAEALALWLRTEPSKAQEAFERQVAEGEVERISAVLGGLDGREALLPAKVLTSIVERYAGSSSPDERTLAAKAFGFLPPDPTAGDGLPLLLQDSDVEVARAAATSAGRLRSPELFPALVMGLARRPVRAQTRRAIARFGPEVVPKLEELLRDPTLDPAARRAIPRTIAAIEDQSSIEALFRCLPNLDPRLHYQAIKSLARLRARGRSLRFSRGEVERVLDHEREGLVTLARLLAPLARSMPKNGSHRLLVQVLEERIEYARERIFHLLGLTYPQEEIASLWNRIATSSPSMRAAALEYLANLLSRQHRVRLFPAIERTTSGGGVLASAAILEGEAAPSLENALRQLAASEDYWVAACAVTVVGELGVSSLVPAILAMKGHPGAIVRESVEKVLTLAQNGTIVT